ncbi:50S ribosomal protein L21 [Gloeomargarita lithophora Alchichica-D10]|uniref:Large ribosomal subunit protein bL21 n=1 Tax=Gloeomargarita lithophora Alchichica-D10 TaxID=1188229 RepID=A0A1J0ABX0_9CYAN|nr:50S ribosomal protein L21 [Gloeomargarita lithophora]APB33424.1 50S ribosomal protein L21 [Gloeomargarita lithophora Alchichica-D10]
MTANYAIVAVGGKQFWVEPGRFYDVNSLGLESGATVTLEQVLLVHCGGQVQIGRPTVPEARIEGKVLDARRGPKVIIYKMRPKKKTRKKTGHRQELTRVLIEKIVVGGQEFTAVEAVAAMEVVETIEAVAV